MALFVLGGGKVRKASLPLVENISVHSVEASNVINDPKCNKGPNSNKFWP